jgi:hypothetical protein
MDLVTTAREKVSGAINRVYWCQPIVAVATDSSLVPRRTSTASPD